MISLFTCLLSAAAMLAIASPPAPSADTRAPVAPRATNEPLERREPCGRASEPEPGQERRDRLECPIRARSDREGGGDRGDGETNPSAAVPHAQRVAPGGSSRIERSTPGLPAYRRALSGGNSASALDALFTNQRPLKDSPAPVAALIGAPPVLRGPQPRLPGEGASPPVHRAQYTPDLYERLQLTPYHVSDSVACSLLPANACVNGRLAIRDALQRLSETARVAAPQFTVVRDLPAILAMGVAPSGERNLIMADLKFMATLVADPEAATFVLAHEIIHVLQRGRYPASSAFGRSKALESDADMGAVELAIAAGLLKDGARSAARAAQDVLPGANRSWLAHQLWYPETVPSHPTGIDRVFNIKGYGGRVLEQAAAPAGPNAPFRTTLTPAAFDREGRLLPHVFVPQRLKDAVLAAAQSRPDLMNAILRNVHLDSETASRVDRERAQGAPSEASARRALDAAFNAVIERPGMREEYRPDFASVHAGLAAAAAESAEWFVRRMMTLPQSRSRP
ncbi:MAG: hypothetical protein HY078_10505 [Elusimicrobia bacterium]|nr:hypothetical protein [Elusimicrobiota bacterium]